MGEQSAATARHARGPVQPPDTGRLVWIDIAKALAIVLVVQYHVATHASAVFAGLSGWAWELWSELAQVLIPVRMPAFFVVSGVLAANALTRRWRDVFRPRYAAILWPFLIWSVLLTVLIALRGADNPWAAILERLPRILQGGDGYWYLSTLVLFFTICRVGRRAPGWLLLGSFILWFFASLVPSVLPDSVPDALAANIYRWASFGMWFVVGAFGRSIVLRIGARPWWDLMVPAVTSFGLCVWLTGRLRESESFSGIPMSKPLSVTGVALLLAVSVLIAKWPAAARLGVYLAARTLPIYVVHAVLVYGVRLVTYEQGWLVQLSGAPNNLIVLLAVPATVMAMVLASTQLADRVAGTPFAWLFTSPGGKARAAPRTA
ncbi:acyltransferase family protein [Pseudactinotalea terrae]|uniref:acyltransferase family protein n=1 Tax=Pseudactinotalea terrae TaxID=1743262 RepID=UPI00139180C6|nr:acyltransferase [Pseudactinotalea terrae]